MQLEITKATLIRAVTVIQKALPARSPLEILTGICISANKETNEIIFRATDLELGIECKLTTENVQESGQVVLPGRVFTELAKRMPQLSISIKQFSGSVIISSGQSEHTLQTFDAEQYPAFPTKSEDDAIPAIQIPLEDLTNAVNQIGFAVSSDASRPAFQGIYFDGVNAVSSDTFRLAVLGQGLDLGDTHPFTLPLKCLQEAVRSSTGTILMYPASNSNQILLQSGNITISSMLIVEPFPKYQKIFPAQEKFTTSFRVNNREFSEALERAALIGEGGGVAVVHLNINSNTGQITITNENQTGKAKEIVSGEVTGENLEVIFNAKYITDVLKVTEEPLFSFTGEHGPALAEEGPFKCILLPIKKG